MSGHRRIGADGDDSIAGDGDRLGTGEGGIDGDDVAILEDEISPSEGRVS